MLLLGPVAAKLGSTGYRFARYYLGAPDLRAQGTAAGRPAAARPRRRLHHRGPFRHRGRPASRRSDRRRSVFLHKVSFIAWFALMTVHVLGHILELPGPAFADWGRRGPRLAGAGLRLAAVTAALAIGAGLALISLSAAGSWG